jgi:hypothetical protein
MVAIAAIGTAQVMHGEILGIIMVFIQGRSEELQKIEIFSDYVAAVHGLRDHKSSKNQIEDVIKRDMDRFKPGKSYGGTRITVGCREIIVSVDVSHIRRDGDPGTEIEVKHLAPTENKALLNKFPSPILKLGSILLINQLLVFHLKSILRVLRTPELLSGDYYPEINTSPIRNNFAESGVAD